MYRLIQRVKNLREDCHMKICDYLTKTYDLIYLPSFNTSQMISSLSIKVARNMATMSHYAFKERFKFKCKQREKTMVECNESEHLALLVSLWKFSIFSEIRTFNEKQRIKTSPDMK
eukprot:NODE_692_length_5142_cov_0.116597.p3 type:complete len:116 gc:universal NODE_692_length_5142_cov_0.116597:3405-3058(-)